jgi:hypothetical protein
MDMKINKTHSYEILQPVSVGTVPQGGYTISVASRNAHQVIVARLF